MKRAAGASRFCGPFYIGAEEILFVFEPVQAASIDTISAHVPYEQGAQGVFMFLPLIEVFIGIHALGHEYPVNELVDFDRALFWNKVIDMAWLVIDDATAPTVARAHIMHKGGVSLVQNH